MVDEESSNDAVSQLDPPRFIPLTKWPQYHVWPTISEFRQLIAKSEALGLDKAIKRVGRKFLIHESEFLDWVNRQSAFKANESP